MAGLTVHGPAPRRDDGARRRAPRGGAARAALIEAGVALWLPVALVALWWMTSANSTSTFFPPLSTVLDTFRDTWLFAEVNSELVPSLRRLAGGVALGSVVGISVGVALGLSDVLRRAFAPAIEFMRAIPPPALVPALIVLLGVGDAAKILLVALGVLWPVLLNAIDGVRAIDPTVVDVMRVHRMPLGLRLRRVVLPAASPQIFAGLRTGLALGLVVMVISEMTASANGLGFFIIQAQQSFAIPEMWSGIIVLGLLGFLVNACFVAVERRALAWHRGWRASTLGERPELARGARRRARSAREEDR